MSRLFAVHVSDPQLLGCVLHLVRADLRTETREELREGYGIGFFQEDRILTQKRPKALQETIDFAVLAADIKSAALVGHARRPTSGALSPEDTHPFQFRNWLFAHHGMLVDFAARRSALENEIPTFLRQHISGGTDSERIFFAFLSALSTATRQRLDDILLRPETVTEALRTALVQISPMNVRSQDTLNTIVSNGRILVASCLGRPVHFMQIQGIRDCERCRQPPLVSGREPTRIHHEHLRAVVVASGIAHPESPWEELPTNTILQLDKDLKLTMIPIET